MAGMENKYYQVGMDGAASQSVTSGRLFKVGIALLCGTGLALFMAQSPMTSSSESTNLVGMLSSSLRASTGAGRPMMISPSIMSAMGDSPFKKLAMTAVEMNSLANRGRDVSMMAANLKNELSNLDPDSKALITRAEGAVKSKALDMAGITEPLGFFDPLGFSTDCSEGRLLFFREVELKHGRVGMLAALGFIVGENFHPLFGGNIDVPGYIAFQQTPLQKFWPAVLIAILLPELASIQAFADRDEVGEQFTMKTDRLPGDFGFDPLGLKPKEPKAWVEMQNKELNNGRLAMLAAAGMMAQELATGQKLTLFPR